MKLKFILSILLFIVTIASAHAQNPDCNDLTVEDIYIDTSGKIAVTIRNTCYSCDYGGLGCVYNEMKLIRTVAPFDTLAESDCWCLSWHDPNTNGELQTYLLETGLTGLPPISDMKVMVTGCACDNIPFGPALSTNEIDQNKNHFQMFPNPAKDILYITNIPENANVEITNVLGNIVFKEKAKSSEIKISTANWAQGVYFISISNNKYRETAKLLK